MRLSRASAMASVFLVSLASMAASVEAAAEGSPLAPFRLTERSDFARYVDGRYVGHAYREARGSLSPSDADREFEGDFFILEETLREMRDVARRVERTAHSRLSIGPSGSLAVRDDSGYPSLRGVPAFPEGSPLPRGGRPILPVGGLGKGATWTAHGTRALDFDNSGSFVVLPFLAEYEFLGQADYRGRKALHLSAKFATRWKAGDAGAPLPEPPGEGSAARAQASTNIVKSALGTHILDILVDAETFSTLFIRDRFDETFALGPGAAGSSERRSGFSLFFFESSVPLDRGLAGEAIAAAVAGVEEGTSSSNRGKELPSLDPSRPSAGLPLAGEGSRSPGEGGLAAAGLELASSPEGLVLRVRDLRFVADSDAILPAELWRLDAIAAALKALPNRSFLVAGHSASVGKGAGELELSVRRAKRVTDELAARGIDAGRLMYKGFGSSRPLASNDSEEGRAKNRRVEITILD